MSVWMWATVLWIIGGTAVMMYVASTEIDIIDHRGGWARRTTVNGVLAGLWGVGLLVLTFISHVVR